MTVLGEDEVPPEEGEHVTFVDEIEKADVRWTNRKPKREYLVITLGQGSRKVTATFFNAKYLKKEFGRGRPADAVRRGRLLQGQLQLTHPAFLVLDPTPAEPSAASRSRRSPTLAVGER